MINIAILGSSGSIGRQTLAVARQHPDRINVVALAAGTNIEILCEQIEEFAPSLVSVADQATAHKLNTIIKQKPSLKSIDVTYGSTGLNEVATHDDVEMLVTAVVGTLGLMPTIAAIKKGKTIALANKETLVAAGEIVTDLAKLHNVKILPVDSEHSAIFQCLQGYKYSQIKKLHITASGGSFRGKTIEELQSVKLKQALKHPNWSMGSKITIDSATLMNKGLEVIEAHWLFNVSYDDINVIVHPESIVHSLVEFQDTSVLAQLGYPSMILPIQYALFYPERLNNNMESLDLTKLQKLHFAKPDVDTFRCLQLAYDAGRSGGTLPAVLNAANEVAVNLFLQEKINFLDIQKYVEKVMLQHQITYSPNIEQIMVADRWARQKINEIYGGGK